jgi:hypothetical protein
MVGNSDVFAAALGLRPLSAMDSGFESRVDFSIFAFVLVLFPYEMEGNAECITWNKNVKFLSSNINICIINTIILFITKQGQW